MVTYDCWLGKVTTTSWEKPQTMNTTMTKMDFCKEGWKYVLEEDMAQCVMTFGTIRMPLWSADSWDSHPMVRLKYITHKYILVVRNTCLGNTQDFC